MRYVRMEDGHIVDTSVYKKVVERTFNGEVVGIDLNHWGQDSDKEITYIPVEDIVRQADTIEDLCDRFVLIDKDDEGPIEQELIGKRYRAMLDELKFRISTGCDPRKLDFYGAIWTDKGLIYVAKFNVDTGELVLL